MISRADAICTNALRTIRAVPPSSAQYAKVASVVAHEATQLRALPHATADAQLFARYLGAISQLASDYRTLARAEAAGRRSQIAAALAELKTNPAPRLAARYGLRECAGAGATVGSG